MKKWFISFIAISSILLTGCSKNKEIANNPYEIIIGNEILSYYNQKEDIPENIIVKSISEYVSTRQNTNDNIIFINEDGHIRMISIIDDSIITYKGIKVGDDISKVIDEFDYEYQYGKKAYAYGVVFDGNIEKQHNDENTEDNWIDITYFVEDSKIIKIKINDFHFSTMLE